MGIFDEKVPKALYDAEVDRRQAVERQLERAQERNEKLTDTIARMKRTGYVLPPATRSAPKPPALDDQQIIRRAEGEFIDDSTDVFLENMVADMMREHGVSRSEAEAEAKRMREELGNVSFSPEQ